MHKALHLKDHIDRLYVVKKRRRGLTSIEDCIDSSIQELEDNIRNIKERLITAANNSIGKNFVLNQDIL